MTTAGLLRTHIYVHTHAYLHVYMYTCITTYIHIHEYVPFSFSGGGITSSLEGIFTDAGL